MKTANPRVVEWAVYCPYCKEDCIVEDGVFQTNDVVNKETVVNCWNCKKNFIAEIILSVI